MLKKKQVIRRITVAATCVAILVSIMLSPVFSSASTLKGKVDKIEGNSISVDGKTVQITPQTEIKGTITEGSTVKVQYAHKDSDPIVAKHIKVEEKDKDKRGHGYGYGREDEDQGKRDHDEDGVDDDEAEDDVDEDDD